MSSDDRWSIATGEDDGKPLIFHIRKRAPAFATKAAFPYFLAVCWPFEPPNTLRGCHQPKTRSE